MRWREGDKRRDDYRDISDILPPIQLSATAMKIGIHVI